MEERPISLGLCLSGGGFRATLFHLGVVRLLHDCGLLGSVKRIAAASGGSILAAHLGLHWERYTGSDADFEAAAGEVIAFARSDVRRRILRRWALSWSILLPHLLASRRWMLTTLLQREYMRLYGRSKLGDLLGSGRRPGVYLNCASLTTGQICSFGRSGFMYYRADQEISIKTPSLPVAFAVAASSAFPPLFPPIPMSNRTLHCDTGEFPKPFHLTDGGIYDNLAIDRLLWWNRQAEGPELDLLLVSDAEGNFDWTDDAYVWMVPRNVRATDLLMKRVSELRYESFDDTVVPIQISRERAEPLDPTVLGPELQRKLRNVRTDLDAFTLAEVECLIRHGYSVARQALLAKGLIPPGTPGCAWRPTPLDAARLGPEALARSHRRSWSLWHTADPASWISGLLVALAAYGVYRLLA